MKNSMCTLLGTPPNLVIVYTALKPRHRRTLTIVIESVGKILLEKEKHKQLSKAAPSNVHWRTLKTPKKMKLIKFYLFSMYQFFWFWQQWTSTRQQNMFLISCRNINNVRTTVYRIAIPLDSKVANWKDLGQFPIQSAQILTACG